MRFSLSGWDSASAFWTSSWMAAVCFILQHGGIRQGDDLSLPPRADFLLEAIIRRRRRGSALGPPHLLRQIQLQGTHLLDGGVGKL